MGKKCLSVIISVILLINSLSAAALADNGSYDTVNGMEEEAVYAEEEQIRFDVDVSSGGEEIPEGYDELQSPENRFSDIVGQAGKDKPVIENADILTAANRNPAEGSFAPHAVLEEAAAGTEEEISDDMLDSDQGIMSASVSQLAKGSYDEIEWELMSDGLLTIRGTGSVQNGWGNQTTDLRDKIKRVVIESGITAVGDGAFIECVNLTDVTIPEGVVSIGYGSFAGCSSLKNISLPSTCTAIGDYSFYECGALSEILLPDTLVSIGEYAFTNCVSLTSLELPESTVSVGDTAFGGCVGLTSAVLYGNIDNYAFYGCTSLEKVDIKGGCSFLGEWAFDFCPSLSSIQIPDTCQSFGDQAFAGCESLTDISMPSGIKSIGNHCFYECSSLKSISLPEGLKTLGTAVFGYCDQLERAVLPSTLTEIGGYCFEYCTSLSGIDLPDKMTGLSSLGEYAFIYCENLKQVTIPQGISRIDKVTFGYCKKLNQVSVPDTVVSVGDGAFGCCEVLEGVDLPDTCSEIGTEAFYECGKLKEFQVPESVTELSDGLFYDCSQLQTITLPKGLTVIKSYVFARCVALKGIDLAESVQEIGEYSFSECSGLLSVKIPENVKSLPKALFAYDSELKEIRVPDTLTEIGEFCFYDCSSVLEINIPVSVMSIGEGAFIHCLGLSHIEIPDGITMLPANLCVSCENLTEVVLPDGMTDIGENAFANCYKLNLPTFPGKLKNIGQYAFANCEKISSLNIPEGVETIGECAFANCAGLNQVSMGKSVASIGDYAFSGCGDLKGFDVDAGNPSYCSEGGILYTRNKKKLIVFPNASDQNGSEICNTVEELAPGALYGCQALKTLVLPEALKVIPDRAFYGCSNLRTVRMKGAVESIGMYSFGNCQKLQSITLSDHITTIGLGAFWGDLSLKQIRIPGSVTKIEDIAFYGCSSLETADFSEGLDSIGEYSFGGCSALSGLKLPDSLTQIGEGAFWNCSSMEEICLPAKVDYISGLLFQECASLQKITFMGDVFAIGNYAFQNCTQLECVEFRGNAPESIGKAAFSKTADDMAFFYIEGAKRWEAPEWTGPDGELYHTETFHSGSCGENAVWVFSPYDGSLKISGSGDMHSWASAEEVPWHEYSSQIKSVTIEEGITSIGACAFMNCSSLTNASLADSIKTIRYAAFAECPLLSDVTSPNGIHDVAPCMFFNCSRLNHVKLSESVDTIDFYSFFKCISLTDLVLPQNTAKVEEGAFAECISLQNISFECPTVSIGKGAFINCVNLLKVYFNGAIPDDIAEYAFSGVNAALTLYSENEELFWNDKEGETHNNVTSNTLSGTAGENIQWRIDTLNHRLILEGSGATADYEGKGAPWFAYRDQIYSIKVGEGITGIGAFAFEGLDLVSEVVLPETLTSVGAYAFSSCYSISRLQIPEGVTAIGEGAFSGCVMLKSIEIPEGVASIEDYTFSVCSSLQDVFLPDGIRKIGYGAFYGCSGLTELMLPEKLETVGGWAFTFCVQLKKMEFPGEVREIGSYACFGCETLTEIRLNNVLTKLDRYVFSQTAVREIDLPDQIEEIGDNAFELCDQLEHIDLPDSCRIVGDSAFYGCTALTEIDLKNVAEIREKAFAATGLLSVRLPASVNAVGNYVFANCVGLSAIESLSPVFQTKDGVLYKGTMLFQYPAGRKNRTYTVSEETDQIAEGAFYGARNLVEADLGGGVRQIGKAAFVECEALKSVKIGGHTENINVGAFAYCPNLSEVRFDCDAPKFSEDAFYEGNKELTLYYRSSAAGWTEGSWTDDCGIVYKTVQMQEEAANQGFLLRIGEADDIGSGQKGLEVSVTSENADVTVPLLLILGMYDGSHMLTSDVSRITLDKNQTRVFRYTAANPGSGSCVYKAFLVDGETYIPLTDSAEWTASDALERESQLPDIHLESSDIDPGITEDFSVVSYDEDVPQLAPEDIYTENTITLSITEESGKPQQQANGITHEYTFDMDALSDISKMAERVENGEPLVEFEHKIEENPPRFEVSGSLTLFDETLCDETVSLGNVEYTYGDGLIKGATKLSTFSREGKMTFDLGGVSYKDKKLEFTAPKGEIGASLRYAVAESSGEFKDLKIGTSKIKTHYQLTGGEVKLSANGEFSSEEVSLGVSAMVNVAKESVSFTFVDEDGLELWTVEPEAGVGAGVEAVAAFEKGKAHVKVGYKQGAGGGVGVTVDVVNCIKHVMKHPEAVLWTSPVYHLMNLYGRTASGTRSLLGSFMVITDPDTTVIKDIVKIPVVNGILSTILYSEALPLSQGGTLMPSEGYAGGGGGGGGGGSWPEDSTDEIAKDNGKTDDEKQNISDRLGLTEQQKMQLFIELMRCTMMHLPEGNSLLQRLIDTAGFPSWLPSLRTQTMSDVWLSCKASIAGSSASN